MIARESQFKSRSTSSNTTSQTPVVRCAIYCRKSTDEGLSQEFNSLDAQRESCLAYVASQKQQGWVALPERYDDGGFSGGNTERPALKRLLADIDAGKVDCVICYKLDRLSRSLHDFSNLMATFEKRNVSFVSVTQQFASNTSMGKLTLHILMSFAQFEREVIAERTRDKIHQTRRRGIYVLGKPVLGYDYIAAPPPFTGKRLAVNETEAEQVRAIFDLYLQHRSLLKVASICNERGWTTKSWTTTGNHTVGGKPFNKCIVSKLLKHPLYVGRVPYRGETFAGEHEAIIDTDTFNEVQQMLGMHRIEGGALVRPTNTSLLKGIIRCGSCNCAMTPTSARRNRADGSSVTHRYYLCQKASKFGREQCACPSLPAIDIEDFVLEHVRNMLSNQSVEHAVVERAIAMVGEAKERRLAQRARVEAKIVVLLTSNRTAAVRRELERMQRRLKALVVQIDKDERMVLDEDELAGAIEGKAGFDRVWNALTSHEKHELVRELVTNVTYDAQSENATVTFRDGVGVMNNTNASVAA